MNRGFCSVSKHKYTDTPTIKHYQVVIGKRGYSVWFIRNNAGQWRSEVNVLKPCGPIGRGRPIYVAIDPDGPTARRVIGALIFNLTTVWC